MDAFSSNIEDIKDYLIEEDINPSYHRLKIFEYLSKNKNHPTVDDIYNKIIKQIPTLSKTTVYNTLNLFQKKGIVNELIIEENELRYDSNKEPHAHFKCYRCGKVYDIHIDCPVLYKNTLNGHKINESHLYFKGVCKSCLGKH